jgi:hypothetical protein
VDAASGGRRDGRGEKPRHSSIRLVKRLFAVAAGALGIRALLRRRHRPPAAEPPVDELREKLAQSKVVPDEPEAPTDVEARRADVHERARKAIDELS